MIGATIAMAVMAVLFVVFGALHLGEKRRGCGGGSCDSCSTQNDCDIGAEGRLP